MLMPGARMTSFPRPRASSPNTLPNLRARLGFHVVQRHVLLGSQLTKSVVSSIGVQLSFSNS